MLILVAGIVAMIFISIVGYRSLAGGVADRATLELVPWTSVKDREREVTTWIEELSRHGFVSIGEYEAHLGAGGTTAVARICAFVDEKKERFAIATAIYHITEKPNAPPLGTTVCFFELLSELLDGRAISTSNAPMDLLDADPRRPSKKLPHVKTVEELFQAHAKEVDRHRGNSSVRALDPDSFVAHYVKATREAYEYQVERGLLRRDGEYFLRTPKFAVRGLLRHLFPVLERGGWLYGVKLFAMGFGAYVVGELLAGQYEELGVVGSGLFGAGIGALAAWIFHPTTLVGSIAMGTAGAMQANASEVPMLFGMVAASALVTETLQKRALEKARGGMGERRT
ncbi:MAG: hypothetical protein HY791_31685 [Deltaproteobacteria bacterium]|nr:hypothetical protein [Deltaproteobacteria bacterium]